MADIITGAHTASPKFQGSMTNIFSPKKTMSELP